MRSWKPYIRIKDFLPTISLTFPTWKKWVSIKHPSKSLPGRAMRRNATGTCGQRSKKECWNNKAENKRQCLRKAPCQHNTNRMNRELTSWYSHTLDKEMPIVTYGHYGFALLLIPTAAADYLE